MGALDGVPADQPALRRADAVSRLAAATGFDWDDPAGARAKVIVVSNEIGLGVVPLGSVTRRYVDELGRLNQRIAALATHPQRSQKRGGGERDVPVQMPGTTVRPGEWIYADVDGVLVSATPL